MWCKYSRVQRLRLPIKGLKLWRFDNTISEFWAYFHRACAETAVSTEYLITFPSSETVTAHAPCHVTSNGGKNSPNFWNPWPQFAYSLCHFHAATTKIKPCYRLKIAVSHYEGNKVYCACAVLSDLCIGGHPKPHVTIFWPRVAYSLYNFYGATMTIKIYMGAYLC